MGKWKSLLGNGSGSGGRPVDHGYALPARTSRVLSPGSGYVPPEHSFRCWDCDQMVEVDTDGNGRLKETLLDGSPHTCPVRY
jgi:hypothetical protein